MALTRITKGVIKPNEDYQTGIITATGLDVNGNADISGSLSVGGVLTYEDVTSIDSVGIITARTGLVSPYADIDDFVSVGSNIHLGNAGVVTATSFVGSGAALTGIDATAIKDSGGNVKVQAQASGAMYTGIHTFSSGAEVGSNIKLGNAGVITATSFVGSGAALTGIDATAIKDSSGNVKVQAQASGAVYTGIHTFGTNTNFTDIDVDGHTNLDNVNVAGVSTFAGTLNASTVSSTAFIASGDLDIDGHTNLDNVSVAGVSTFSGTTTINTSGNEKLILSGSVSPYIQFQEGTTNKAYVQWASGGNYLQVGNEQESTVVRIGSGETGLIYRVGTNNRTVWTSGNDGASSGLDADLLDGQQGSYYTNAANLTGTLPAISGANLTSLPSQATIANNADNRIITGGSGVNLNGEANLTFNGSLLDVSGSARANNFYLRANGSAPSADASIFRPADNTLALATASTERLRIGSSGGVGINTSLIRNNRFLNIAAPSQDFSNNSTELMDGGGICLQHTDTLASTNRTYPGIFWSGNTASLGRARAGILGITASNNDATDIVFLTRTAANGTGFYPSDERMRIMKDGRIGIKFKGNYTMNSASTNLVIGDGGSGVGITLWTASAADNQTISFQTNETLSRAEGEISYGPTGTSTVADRNAMMFRTNSAERFRIDKNGTLTNTTNSSHSQGAGTFNVKGVINQYSQGSGSGLIFDCDFGRLTGYGDNSGIANSANLSAALAHSTTDWVSSSSNTPMTVNGGSFNYRVGFGGYLDCVQNEGRVSIGAGSGSPNMAQLLNTASMTIESWIWYDGAGREVIASRFGSGFPNQFNMIADPDGQFHYNSGGVGASGGNVTGQHFPDKTWHHHLWQYESGVHRWYINGAFANSRSAGSSLAVSSNTGFSIASRSDDMERWDGKIAVVRIYNRALSATEIKNHFELERGRFGV